MARYLIKQVRPVDSTSSFISETVDILIADDKIIAVASSVDGKGDETIINGSGLTAVPGLVDMHTHLREPGFKYKETIATGLKAAVHGGFTDVVSMPNTNPVTDNAAIIEYQLSTAQKAGGANLHVAGALSKGQEGEQLSAMGWMVEAGVVAFSDDGFWVQNGELMRKAMEWSTQFDLPILTHAESTDLSGDGVVNDGPICARLGLAGQPAAAEEIAISRDIALAELTGARLHIQHVTTAGAVALIKEAKARGVRVTAEVTPHHLFLTEDNIDDTFNTYLKVNPPLRRKADNEALQNALLDGSIDCIASDHAPHAAHEKALEFELAPFGMTGLETSFAAAYTNLVLAEKLTLEQLVDVMSHAPRRILNLDPVSLASGSVANITLLDLTAEYVPTEADFVSRSVNNGFIGHKLNGRAKQVFVGGVPQL